ncbi:TDT family transporter [Vagococcus hydrophili]|uniref:TDT family transporter n=1 Tax=Vagococcus hydrophili TaxID=2714947 RepID=A0A6G8AQH4_9ENTE|nr:TDT family transporter [Vagococcus hydrophili]QIL47219.1 TDT family transporter [Vagococcus hydrophili]
MKQFLVKLPLPISALGLSFAGLANLFNEQLIFKYLFITLSILILLSVLLKVLIDSKNVLDQLKQVPIAATFPTFFMGIALLTKQIAQWNLTIALILWIIATLGHVSFIVYFTREFVMKKDLTLILPSWFVVYVGIVASSVTAPLFDSTLLMSFGKIFLIFGMLAFLILFPVIIKRMKKYPLPKPLQATVAIFSAPVALNLVGYFSVITTKNAPLILVQFTLMLGLYLWVIRQLFTLLNTSFSPAQAALTFPMVISATSIKLSSAYFTPLYPAVKNIGVFISYASLIIAVLIVFSVLLKYLTFMTSMMKE